MDHIYTKYWQIQKNFTATFSKKCAKTTTLKISVHQKHVAALPCEIYNCKNAQFSALKHCFCS